MGTNSIIGCVFANVQSNLPFSLKYLIFYTLRIAPEDVHFINTNYNFHCHSSSAWYVEQNCKIKQLSSSHLYWF